MENIRRKQQERSASEKEFENSINTFCEVCTKRCYPNQVSTLKFSNSKPSNLPNVLLQKNQLLLCHRCKTHLSRKITAPPNAFWNKFDPGIIPNEILLLSQAEQRLLSRIPFVKIIKFDGLYGQWGFKGQAVLFAQDIFEFSEQLPEMLPRSIRERVLS